MLFLGDLLKFRTVFGKLWLAGTIGTRKRPFSKDVISNSSINEFVEALFNCETPLAPRLTGTFLCGVTAIYEQKCHYLQLDVAELLNRLHRAGSEACPKRQHKRRPPKAVLALPLEPTPDQDDVLIERFVLSQLSQPLASPEPPLRRVRPRPQTLLDIFQPESANNAVMHEDELFALAANAPETPGTETPRPLGNAADRSLESIEPPAAAAAAGPEATGPAATASRLIEEERTPTAGLPSEVRPEDPNSSTPQRKRTPRRTTSTSQQPVSTILPDEQLREWRRNTLEITRQPCTTPWDLAVGTDLLESSSRPWTEKALARRLTLQTEAAAGTSRKRRASTASSERSLFVEQLRREVSSSELLVTPSYLMAGEPERLSMLSSSRGSLLPASSRPSVLSRSSLDTLLPFQADLDSAGGEEFSLETWQLRRYLETEAGDDDYVDFETLASDTLTASRRFLQLLVLASAGDVQLEQVGDGRIRIRVMAVESPSAKRPRCSSGSATLAVVAA